MDINFQKNVKLKNIFSIVYLKWKRHNTKHTIIQNNNTKLDVTFQLKKKIGKHIYVRYIRIIFNAAAFTIDRNSITRYIMFHFWQ